MTKQQRELLAWARENGVKSIKQGADGLDVEFFPTPVDFASMFPPKEEEAEAEVPDDVMYYSA